MGFKSKEDVEIVAFKTKEKFGGWTVDKKLGEGGFGTVFKVLNAEGEEFALKVERNTEATRVLKMEVYVLRELKKASAHHFCDIIESGKIANLNYLVMTLVGPSLQDLRRHEHGLPKHNFSWSTAIQVGQQSVEAIEEIHSVGFLHRDIKPGNFAVGHDNCRHIVLFDFGMARKYLDAYGQVRRPRWAIGFRGTLMYAPLSSHVSREMSRKDDLETWLGALTWKMLEDKDELGRAKERARLEPEKLFHECPPEYHNILNYIDSLRYYDEPDYTKISAELSLAVKKNNINLETLDWEKWLTKTNSTQ